MADGLGFVAGHDVSFYVEIVGGTLFACCVIYIVLEYLAHDSHKKGKNDLKDENFTSHVKEKPESDIAKNVPKTKKGVLDKKKEVKDQYTHPWLLTNLKGHSGQISDIDFSPNGKYIASCADDRSVMLWSVKTLSEKNHRSIRTNIEYDHATLVKWSPDSKAFIICGANENAIQVFKVNKKKDGTLGNSEVILRFPVYHHAEIINIGIACNGLFIMSCSSNTTMIIWDLKGQVLSTIDTLHINNYFASISPCGRFVASSGFTPDVRVWEVCFSKAGEFKEVKRAFELKGHTSGINYFSFSSDSSRMVTVSKDGTWKLWDTNIEYGKGQDPYLLRSCNYNKGTNSLIALSPDGKTVAICSKSDISIFSAATGELQTTLPDIHPDPICGLLFAPYGNYLVAAAGRCIRVYRNILGYQNSITSFEEAKKTATSQTMKERLQSQINEAKLTLKSLEALTVK